MPDTRKRQALRGEEERLDEAAAPSGDVATGSAAAPVPEPTASSPDSGVAASVDTGASGPSPSAEPSLEGLPVDRDAHDDHSAALLAAALGLLGIGGAGVLAGTSSLKTSSPVTPPPAVVADPKNPDHPKSDPTVPDQKPDPGSSKPTGPDQPAPDHPTPEQPKPDQPAPDQSKPDQPKPDQPTPDEPVPDQPKPDQPQQPDPGQPDPGKPDPTPPADPDPTPSAHVPVTPVLSLAADTGRSDQDRVSSSGAVNVAGLEAGATLAVSLDGGRTWSTRGGDTVLPDSMFGADGEQHLQVKQIDAKGSESAVAGLTFTLDRQAPDALRWTMPAGKTALGAADVIALEGVEPDAVVEYRTDAAAPWLVAKDGRIPVTQFQHDGIAHIEVRQTDVAGNVSATSTLVADIDITAPPAPTLSLAKDTGSSDHDRVTSSGAVNVAGLDPGATLAVSLDGGKTWIPRSGDAQLPESMFGADGDKHLQVKQIDAAGNEGAVADLSFTLEREAPGALRWTMPAGKTALGAADVIALEGVEPDAVVEYRTDAAAPWLVAKDGRIPVSQFQHDGIAHIEVRQTDVAGNVSTTTTLVADIDVTAPPAPILSLAKDTGGSDHDLVTSSGSVNVAGLDPGATLAVSLDGGKTWIPRSGDAQLPESMFGADGDKHLQVKQIDAAGNEGAVADLSFTLDRQAPEALHWAMSGDKPALGLSDTIVPLGVEPGARVDYRLDATSPWQTASDGKIPTSIFHQDGAIHLDVRQTDVAGNVGPTTTLTVDVDVTAPPVPILSLLGPTALNQDGLTVAAKPDLKVTGLESGNATFYSLDQGQTWTAFSGDTLPASLFGASSIGHERQVVEVKQVDGAGNGTVSAPFQFVFDNFAATPYWVAPFQEAPTGGAVYGADGMPLKKAVLGLEDTLVVYGLEREAHQQFSVDGGGHWSDFSGSQLPVKALFDGEPDGNYTLMLRQTDLVGNHSAVSSSPISVDIHAPAAPTLALRKDDGSSATDRVTSDGAIVVVGQESGLKVQFSFADESYWHDAGTLTGPFLLEDYNHDGRDGPLEMAVRLVDAAGNVGASTSLSFTLVHSPI